MATSKLQQYTKNKLNRHFGGIEILENIRPEWLISERGERLELDFYLPSLDIAIEVQGKQHYTFVPFFHQEFSGFKSQIRRDVTKKKLCKKNGISLFEVASCDEANDTISDLLKMYGEHRGAWHPLELCLKRRESVKARYIRMIGREINNKNRNDRKAVLLERMNRKLIKYGGESMNLESVMTILENVNFIS